MTGFINAKIAIKDRLEQVLNYIEPTGSEDEVVEGWFMKDAPKPVSEKSDLHTESTGSKKPPIPPMPEQMTGDDSFMPF